MLESYIDELIRLRNGLEWTLRISSFYRLRASEQLEAIQAELHRVFGIVYS